MLFKLSLFFVSILSILQVWYDAKLTPIFIKPILQVTDYQAFSNESKSLILWMGLFLLVSCFFSSKKEVEKSNIPTNLHWIRSFLLVFSLVVGLILSVNPDGRFPWNERDAYITIAARSIKPNLYKDLKATPDVLILGSSVSFTTPTSYFAQKKGVSAFNMALNGGGPIDFVNMLNYLIEKSSDKKLPSTILVEILSPSLKISTPNLTPTKIIPYMSVNHGFLALGAATDYLIRTSSFSDAIFTLLFVDTHHWQIWVEFTKDGTGIQKGVGIYEKALKNDTQLMDFILSCPTLNAIDTMDADGIASIERLVALSHQYQFSLVFYRTPVNTDFYTASKTSPEQYAACKNLLNAYMKTLTEKNTNVFYSDLSAYEKISTLKATAYTDGHHLKREGSVLLLQALDNEINSALEWAKANRK